ncbi:hypothetical protein F4801DRAFT_589989 [Xylaria longipes]|nr:hypothetical protein F4801DRAFT_589989 [Xylaria longipes]
MTWFNEQIQQDIITQRRHLLESFVELLHMHSHAEIEPFNLTQIDEVFNEWLEKDAVQNPAYRRRYLITQQDVHLLFSKKPRQLQNSGAPSLFDRQHGGGESHSPALSCEQEDKNVRAEKEKANLRRNTGHGTPQRAAIPTEAKLIEIEKAGHFNEFLNTDAILSQRLNDTRSQDTDADDGITMLRETIVIDSSPDAEMRRTATRAGRPGRKYKVFEDLELSTPPKNYICRRCHEPGHWIQHCPTNLDPRYDSAPAHDYRCNFCGRKGDHFATLCSKNPNEGSLTKQREHAIAETREPRTPTRSSRRHYQHQESSATRSRGRHRSHSPGQRAQSCFRSRTPEYRRPRRGGTNDYDPRIRNEDDRHRRRHGDESDVSPYAARVRLTRELYMSSDNTKERGSSSRSRDDSFRFERRSSTPPPLHRCRSPFVMKPRRGHRDLDKVTKTDEGRLAYDDESEIGPKSSLCSSILSPQRHMNAGSVGREEAISSALSSMVVSPNDHDQVELKAEDFLCTLAAEIMLKNENISRSVEANTYEDELEVDECHAMEDCKEGSDCSDTTNESEPPAVQTTSSPECRLVQCPPFCPEIVSLFNTRKNPIVNSRAKRKTACQMMERSERFCTRRRHRSTSLPTLPCER